MKAPITVPLGGWPGRQPVPVTSGFSCTKQSASRLEHPTSGDGIPGNDGPTDFKMGRSSVRLVVALFDADRPNYPTSTVRCPRPAPGADPPIDSRARRLITVKKADERSRETRARRNDHHAGLRSFHRAIPSLGFVSASVLSPRYNGTFRRGWPVKRTQTTGRRVTHYAPMATRNQRQKPSHSSVSMIFAQ